MSKRLLAPRRKSSIEKAGIYFWTATINGWRHLLKNDEYKDIIIDSLQHLSQLIKRGARRHEPRRWE
jgi:hypothetical protein